MDFRDWKKVCEDGRTCTLQHPKGHMLTVALKGLSAIHREQIKRLKMAAGGEVDPKKLHGNEISDHKRKKEGFWESEHGKKTLDHVNRVGDDIKNRSRKNYAEGTPDGTVSDDSASADQASNPGGTTHITFNVGSPSAPAAQSQPAPAPRPPPQMAQAVNPAAQMAKAPLQVVPPAPAQSLPNNNPNGQPNPLAISKNAQIIPEAQKDIDIAQAKAEAQNTEQLNKGLGDSVQAYQNRYNDLASHVQDFDNYMQKNPINPKHYQESMGSETKVATAIGLFFGGFGVPFGGHNYALDFLNKQIDRDIESQKSRQDQQKTIFGAYKDLYGEGKEAFAATKATMIDIFNNKQKMIAAQLGTPQAFQKSMALSNQLAIDKEKALREAATPLTVLPGASSTPNPGAPQGKRPSGGAPIPKQTTGGNAPANGQAGGKPVDTSHHPLQTLLLVPNADKKFESVRYQLQAMGREGDLPALSAQYNQATQAEKALRNVNETFLNLWKGANEGGADGRFHRTVDPHALPGSGIVGDVVKGLGYAASQMTNNDINRRYDSEQSNLKGYISAALKGTNIGSGDIEDIVRKNSPEYGDSEKTMALKLKTIRDFIRNHTETSLLKTWKLTKE